MVDTRIEPAWLFRLGWFHRLVLDHTCGWRGQASSQFARLHDERLVNAYESSVAAEAVEVPLRRCEGAELLWDFLPLTGRWQHVENLFNNHAQRDKSRPSPWRRTRHKRRDRHPFCSSKVACIAQLIPTVSPLSHFGSGHRHFVTGYSEDCPDFVDRYEAVW